MAPSLSSVAAGSVTLGALALALVHCAASRDPATASVVAVRIDAGAAAPEIAAAHDDAGARAPVGPVGGDARPPALAHLVPRSIPIPGASGVLSFDYLAADRARGLVYLPVGNTGSLDVFDVASGTFKRVDGFKTTERVMHGRRRLLGPSAVTVGDGFVYVGNRATSEVCAVDAKTLTVGRCLKLPTSTDGVAYVASAKEVWVTTPEDQSLTVLDASEPAALKAKTVIKLEGDVEGYAVDEAHGVFFTNTEDKGTTLVVDVKTHKLRSTWKPGCGGDGPRGVAVDPARGFVFVACTDHVQVLDAAHHGALLGKVETGAGVDNIDYAVESGILIIGAGKVGQVTVAHVDDKGLPTIVAVGTTAVGARNAVGDAKGNAYVPDPATSTFLILAPDSK